MAKLTKVQKEVIDKMSQGWVIRKDVTMTPPFVLVDTDGKGFSKKVNKRTFNSLLNRQMITPSLGHEGTFLMTGIGYEQNGESENAVLLLAMRDRLEEELVSLLDEGETLRLAFDIEVYPNYILLLFKNIETGEVYKFEKWKNTNTIRTRFPKFFKSINIPGVVVYSYNGNRYDMQVLWRIIELDFNVDFKDIYELSKSIIENEHRPVYPKWKFDHRDIQEIGNLNRETSTDGAKEKTFVSLKEAAANTGFEFVRDLPFDPDFPIDPKMRRPLTTYCEGDTDQTIHLTRVFEQDVILRKYLAKKYDLGNRLNNRGEPRVARDVLCNLYEKKTRNSAWKLADRFWSEYADWTRGNVNLKGRDYTGNDRSDALQGIWFNFEELIPGPEHFKFFSAAATKLYSDMSNFSRHFWQKGEYKFRRHVNIEGFDFTVAEGGIHDGSEGGVWEWEKDRYVYQVDVSSYYPNIINNFDLYPRFLPGLKDIYWDIVTERLALKDAGDDHGSYSMKIMINSFYGLLSNEYSPFFDPWWGKAVPLIGQLYFVMLIDWFQREAGMKVVGVNTDGIFVIVDPKVDARFKQMVQFFSKAYNYEMDTDELKKFVKRNVNSYMLIHRNGKLKMTKDFRSDLAAKRPLKGRIIAKSLVEYYLNGTPVEDTINNGEDILDFLFVRSAGKKTRDVFIQMPWGDEPTQIQNTQRWLVTNSILGGDMYSMTKIHGRRDRYMKEVPVLPLLDLKAGKEVSTYPVDKNWYIEEAKKRLV